MCTWASYNKYNCSTLRGSINRGGKNSTWSTEIFRTNNLSLFSLLFQYGLTFKWRSWDSVRGVYKGGGGGGAMLHRRWLFPRELPGAIYGRFSFPKADFSRSNQTTKELIFLPKPLKVNSASIMIWFISQGLHGWGRSKTHCRACV